MQSMYQGYPQGMYQQPTYPTRLPQMHAAPYQPTAPMVQQTPMTFVTSREQAVVAQIPFDGQAYYFANTASGEVYSKRFDSNTGTSPLVVYRKEPGDPAAEYATVGMLQQLAQIVNGLREQLEISDPKGKHAAKEDEE